MILTARSRFVVYLFAIALAETLAIGPASGAMNTWSTQGPGSAAGAAAVMPSGRVPSGSAVNTSVTVSWAAAEFPNGTVVAGYVVNRYNASTDAPATVGAGCSGVVTATTCTELSVQPGTWVYTETPVQLNWTGGASPSSSPIVVT
jgi:hypothetical protein